MKTDETGFSQSVSGILAVLCGLAAAIMMSTKHFIIRLYNKNYTGYDQGIDSSIIEFFIFMFFFFPLLKDPIVDLSYTDMVIGSIAGCLIASSRILLSIGISKGLAGPA